MKDSTAPVGRMPNASFAGDADMSASKATMRSVAAQQRPQYLGTSRLIKLPYVIGKDEYRRHPYAGLLYKGEDELE